VSAPSSRLVVAQAPSEALTLALVAALNRSLSSRHGGTSDHVKNVRTALDAVLGLGGGLSLKGDQDERLLIFNDVPLPMKTQARAIQGLLGHFAATGISEVRCARPLLEPEVEKLLSILRKPKDAADPFAACRKVLEGLWSTGLRGTVDIVSLEQLGHQLARMVKCDGRTRARLVYAKVMAILGDYLASESSDELRRWFGWKLMKSVHALVAVGLDSEALLLGLSLTRGADNYMVNHSVNTAALAILVGKRLGLPPSLLVQLGYAALLHATGRLKTPPAIVNKAPSQRSPAEAKEFARHPYRAVGALLEQRRLDDPLVMSALVAFQHDARRGVPVLRKPLREVHPLSQIVALCQAYDAVATARKTTPTEALAAATQDPTRPFEPMLVRVLGSLVGVLPVPVPAS
jgi:HD-GYP domain-containing protein (c-di-GMP phosphodiesterase class II)